MPVDYYNRYLGNIVVVPACLLGLVAMTWAMDKTSAQDVDKISPSELARKNQKRRTQQKSDYYFAFFLVCEFLSLPHFCLRYIVLHPRNVIVHRSHRVQDVL